VATRNAPDKARNVLASGAAATFVILLGITSLFSDMTYEAGRSLSGQFLQLLGASALAVGVTAGAGELLGYSLRLASGYLADRTRQYWLITLAGYAINLLAIPALALVGRWEFAVGLLFLERIGKAIRSPARDAMLSHATSEMGRGWGFGLHEALDQIGAVLGPLITAGVLVWQGHGEIRADTSQTAFAVLLVPALLALAVLAGARFLFPRPAELESKTPVIGAKGFSRRYWWYLAAVSLVAFGFADFPLMAYHLRRVGAAPEQWIPVFFALAMAVDALAALIAGRLYDRKGLGVLVIIVSASALFAPLVFLGGLPLIVTGLGLWGIGIGAQESIMRAAIAEMVPSDQRAMAYGLFHTGFGISWFVGSVFMGFLYDRSVLYLVILSVTAQILAVPLFIRAARQAKDHHTGSDAL
jgi:MFS family permease